MYSFIYEKEFIIVNPVCANAATQLSKNNKNSRIKNNNNQKNNQSEN